uniref:Alternative protein TRIM6-TRIM34 n=1 Tax=Homo sapiens TaxID=9606 RepID=L8E6Z1_HUMAN|nr:alternative protein TRIM6-TRIM34 [Homo sapiens]
MSNMCIQSEDFMSRVFELKPCLLFSNHDEYFLSFFFLKYKLGFKTVPNY